MGSALIVQAGAQCLPLPDNSVDLICTSPPYFGQRSYQDGGTHYAGQIGSEPTPREFVEALWACTAEWWRVLKPFGSLFVNLGDKYCSDNRGSGTDIKRGLAKYAPRGDAGFLGREMARQKSLMGLPWRYANGCIDGSADPEGKGWILRAEIIWEKRNGLPESVEDRVRRSHETWFHFTREAHYYSAIDEIREPSDPAKNLRPSDAIGPGSRDLVKRANGHGTVGHPGVPLAFHPLGKLPGSVWPVASEPLLIPEAVQAHYSLPDHFAAFPGEFPRRIILGWSPPGVCLACGEGRRPVVDTDLGVKERETPRYAPLDTARHGVPGSTLGSRGPSATITGYACACPDTAAPTRPAVVLDPFSGTGTTIGVARALGRIGIGVDLSHDYCRLGRWRVFESGHSAKAMARTDKERQGRLV